MSEEEQEQANETGKTFCTSPPAMFEQEPPNESGITIPSCSPPGILEWIVKGDDFVHWLTKSKEVVDECCCPGVPPPPPLPEGGFPDDLEVPPPAAVVVDTDNPSSPEGGGFQDGKEQQPSAAVDNVILHQLRSTPPLSERWNSFSSAASSILLPTKDRAEGSVGGTPSTDESEEESVEPVVVVSDREDEGKGRESEDEEKDEIKYVIWVVICVAILLGLLTIGILVAWLLLRGNNDNYNQKPETNADGDIINPGGGFSPIFKETSSPSPVVNGTNSTNVTTTQLLFDYTANTDYLVGVYYYPWYGDDEFHKGEGYLRRDLVPPHMPALGEYDDSDPMVIARHMQWFRRANVGLLVTSWWGPNRTEDDTTRNVIMEHEDVGNLRIALHYETRGRIRGLQRESDITSVVRNDIEYMCEHYLDHPNYYKIDGRPVLFVYVTRVLERDGILEETILSMRSEAHNSCGHNLYIVGDQAFRSAPDEDEDTDGEKDEPWVPFWYFDAVTNYDVYGSSAGSPNAVVGSSFYAGRQAMDDFYAEQEKWKNLALEQGVHYIPPVSPGYNDRASDNDNDNEDQPPLSRRLTSDSEEGSLFWYQLKKALPLVSPSVDKLIMVNSFNQWHQDTQIEPTTAVSSVDVVGTPTITRLPVSLTRGLRYVAYGELYLDILGAATSKNPDDTEIFDDLFGGGGD